MSPYLLLVLTLATDNASLRMRIWRGIKASGAATLRDGVYLLPARPDCRAVLQGMVEEVLAANGAAWLLETPAQDGFPALFDRAGEYQELLREIQNSNAGLNAENAVDRQKQARKLRKAFTQLREVDFFPGEAQRQVHAALEALEAAAERALSPDEPHFVSAEVKRLDLTAYRGRHWATRQRPWVDRLASAWLIRRFIDPDAQILWLASPADCPADALGFDFDGATFSHVGARVTFETLLASFGLDEPALTRLGGIVHFLDVGGIQPPEAAGVEQVLAGLRATVSDDDQLLQMACGIFDGLLAGFRKGATP